PANGCGSTSTQCSSGTWASCQNPCDPYVGCSPCTPNCSGGGDPGCLTYPGGLSTEGPHPCGGGTTIMPLDPIADPIPPVLHQDARSPIGISLVPIPPSGTPPLPPADYRPSLLASIQRFNSNGSAALPPSTFQYTTDITAQKIWTAAIPTSALPFN